MCLTAQLSVSDGSVLVICLQKQSYGDLSYCVVMWELFQLYVATGPKQLSEIARRPCIVIRLVVLARG